MIRKSGSRFSEKIMPAEKRDPEKHALGLDPRVEAGFPKRSCTAEKHDPEKACPKVVHPHA
jgi:hypothetical protein